MSIFNFIKEIFKPATELVDNVHTSSEERMQLKNELSKIETSFSMKLVEYESQLSKLQSEVLVTEAKGNFLQRTWRPVTMYVFLILIVMNSLNILPGTLPLGSMDILQYGLAGYVVGRSGEKMISTWARTKKQEK